MESKLKAMMKGLMDEQTKILDQKWTAQLVEATTVLKKHAEEINSLSAKVGSVTDRVTGHDARIAALEKKDEELESNIGTLKKQFTEHEDTVKKLQVDMETNEKKIEGQQQMRSHSMPAVSTVKRVHYPECEENEKDRHEAAVTLQLRIEDKVDRQDLNTAVASILDSAGIDITSKVAKSFTVATLIFSSSSRLLPVHLVKVLQTSECESREMKSSLQVSFWSTGLSEEMMLPMMSGPGFLSF